jgi:hypothetical protein
MEVINKIKYMHTIIYINVGQVFFFKETSKIHTLKNSKISYWSNINRLKISKSNIGLVLYILSKFDIEGHQHKQQPSSNKLLNYKLLRLPTPLPS